MKNAQKAGLQNPASSTQPPLPAGANVATVVGAVVGAAVGADVVGTSVGANVSVGSHAVRLKISPTIVARSAKEATVMMLSSGLAELVTLCSAAAVTPMPSAKMSTPLADSAFLATIRSASSDAPPSVMTSTTGVTVRNPLDGTIMLVLTV